MKRVTSLLLAFLLLCSALTVGALAADASMSFRFELSSGGQASLSAQPGDELTVAFILRRADAAESYRMHAFQNEIAFDDSFFELVDGSVTTASGVGFSVHESAGVTKIFVNDYSLSAAGDEYPAELEAGSFKLRVVGASGSGTVRNTACLVSTSGGTDSYAVSVSDLTVTLPGGSTGGGAASPTTPTGEYINPFADVAESAWYFDAVKYVCQAELYEGTSATTFDPESTMTRAMFVTVLHRYAKLPTPTSALPFTDLGGGLWYSDAIAWAAEQKIVDGYGGGIFGPNDSITLEQMIAVLYRYTGAAATGEPPTAYGEVSAWASDAMGWAESVKLFDDVGGKLTAKQPATRAQVAAFMANFSELSK